VKTLQMPIFLALVLGAMSVGVLLVALVEVGASQTRWGQLLLLVGSIGEFLTLMTLTFFDLVAAHGLGWELGASALEVMLLFLVAFALLASLRLLVWWFPHSFQRWVREEDPSELGVRFGFVLMLGLATLAAWVGLEAILGAFLAGMLFTYVFRETGPLETKLVALGQGFFVPVFFINVGLTFDWGALGDPATVGKTLVVLAGLSLLVKAVPTLLLLVLRIPFRAVAAGAFLLATPLTLLVAIATLGLEIGVLDKSTSAAVVLLAIVSGVVFPTAFKLLTPRPDPAD
jgi:Kef-type K+ transport system membrane component KefB